MHYNWYYIIFFSVVIVINVIIIIILILIIICIIVIICIISIFILLSILLLYYNTITKQYNYITSIVHNHKTSIIISIFFILLAIRHALHFLAFSNAWRRRELIRYKMTFQLLWRSTITTFRASLPNNVAHIAYIMLFVYFGETLCVLMSQNALR